MATRYFKATRPDGRDFYTGTVDYGAALASGEPVTHPSPGMSDAGGYLSVSVSPSDCTGMAWPCRLFAVEPVDPWVPDGTWPSKRACHALRVVEELPAHEALGPQGVHVAALIDRARSLTAGEAGRLGAAWAAALAAARDAWDAAREAVREAEREAAWGAAREAVRNAWRAAFEAEREAARALVVRDLINTDHYDTLTMPWRTAIGPIHPDDPDTTPQAAPQWGHHAGAGALIAERNAHPQEDA